ncbi:palmitoyltransferase ZDHHC3-like [Branchiostoma floridae]|uniref:Palmitoyltransferase n=1 Tax=Branchiostoma floridae TaxID=7739 RepID=C3ZIH4_BRAFL|nr:palmitoyltransferase ZDHHC3-like [Branchiostoma floridae]|eukprot:XP_002591688.1 hypothetical protein BRAFLDRAFT_223325 [Branchiostoma floridae]
MAVFRADPCGIICIVVTYAAVIYADYVVVRHLAIPTMTSNLWGAFHVVLFNIIVFLLTLAHLRAVFSDPGIVPLPANNIDFSDVRSAGKRKLSEKEAEDWTVCARCDAYRPPRAHHCKICRRCIRRMDHHCPWINNCVGELNQKFFIQFLFYTGVACCYALLLVIISWVIECTGPGCKIDHQGRQTRVVHSVILTIEAILFGLFVSAIMCDQLSAIFTDETAVEQIQKRGRERERPRKPKMALLAEVFGRGKPLLWLCPCQAAPDPQTISNPQEYDV